MSAICPPPCFPVLRRAAHSRAFLCLLVAMALAPGGATPLTGQSPSGSASPADPRIAGVIAQLEETRIISQVALSPDSNLIAWVVDKAAGTEIQVASTADPAHSHRLTAGSGAACTEETLAWSPNSKELAFISDCNAAGGPDQADVYLAAPTASSPSPRRLTHLHGGVTSLAFSPDGLYIACLYIEGATRPAGALAPMKPPAGEIGVEGLEIQRIATIETASGEFRLITPATLHVYEYDWAPDSRQIAYTAAAPPGENNWWVAQLYTQSLASGEPHSVLAPESTPGPLHGLQIAVPRWSPDRQQIAFIGGLMSDQGSTGGDIYLISATGGEPKNITPDSGKTVAWIDWRTPSAPGSDPKLLVSWVTSGLVEIGEVDASNGKITASYATIPASISDGRLELSLSVAANRTVAYTKSSFASAPEVYVGPLGGPAQAITHYNDALKPTWGKAESIHWTSGSFPVQGWLLYPAHYDPSRKYPLIVSVHGGPSAAVLAALAGSGLQPRCLFCARLFCSHAQPARQLR